MSNKTKPAQPAKHSSRVQKRRTKKIINPIAFAQLYGGSVEMRSTEGVYYFGFTAPSIRAHAWGSSFALAYRHFLRNFYQKYPNTTPKNA